MQRVRFLPRRAFARQYLFRRPSTSPPYSTDSKTTNSPDKSSSDTPFYVGPLDNTFRRLKLFSLSSLGLATSISPIIFLVDSPLPMSARTGMIATALLTSAGSTALVTWMGSPYVSSMRRLPVITQLQSTSTTPSLEAIELHTKNLLLRPLITTVSDPSFLTKALNRPFANWELIEQVRIPRVEGKGKEGTVERVAETVDRNGNVVGEWTVEWKVAQDDTTVLEGVGKGSGNIVRYFNVHEELLEDSQTDASAQQETSQT